MNIQGLTFTKKSNCAGGSIHNSVDVSVTLQNNSKNVAFSFSKSAFALMNKPAALVAACTPTRVYFMESSPSTGFKASIIENYTRVPYRFPRAQLPVPTSSIGYYDLQWDANRELFYIDLQGKKSGV